MTTGRINQVSIPLALLAGGKKQKQPAGQSLSDRIPPIWIWAQAILKVAKLSTLVG